MRPVSATEAFLDDDPDFRHNLDQSGSLIWKICKTFWHLEQDRTALWYSSLSDQRQKEYDVIIADYVAKKYPRGLRNIPESHLALILDRILELFSRDVGIKRRKKICRYCEHFDREGHGCYLDFSSDLIEAKRPEDTCKFWKELIDSDRLRAHCEKLKKDKTAAARQAEGGEIAVAGISPVIHYRDPDEESISSD